MNKRLLVIGEGHGAEALLRGLYLGGYRLSVCSSDVDVLSLAENFGFGVVNNIESWISDGDGLVISSGYRKRIDVALLSKAEFLNIHYALFPKYRGMHSIVWAILNGDRNIGLTVHKMNKDLDAGPIIWQKRVHIGSRNSWELMLFCDSVVESQIGDVLRKYESGRLKPIEQKHHKATYVAKRNRSDCEVDWDLWDIPLFKRHMKALVSPYPLPYFNFKQKNFEIIEIRFMKTKYFELPGHVVYVSGSEIYVKLKDGVAIIKSLRDEEGNLLEASEVINTPGARLRKSS